MEKGRKIRCGCGGFFSEKEVSLDGIKTNALVCKKCKKTTFTLEQAEEYGRLKEIHTLINEERKIIRIGNSMGITLPERLGLKPGKKVRLEAINSKSFKVVFG